MGTIYPGKAAESEELNKLADKTYNVIFETSSVFPFQLFPDKVIIDENKVTVVRKELFFKRVFPIPYESLVTVKVNRNIFFASLEFEVKRMEENPRPVTFLWSGEASLAEKYIMALVHVKRSGIDISKLSITHLRKRLEEIGRAGNETEGLF